MSDEQLDGFLNSAYPKTDFAFTLKDWPEVYQPLFYDIDSDKDGKVHKWELRDAFKRFNMHIIGKTVPVPKDFDPCPTCDFRWIEGTVIGDLQIGGAEPMNEGKLKTFLENHFKSAKYGVFTMKDTPEVYQPLFNDMDSDKDGKVSIEEMAHAFKRFNIHVKGYSIPDKEPTPEPVPEKKDEKTQWHWKEGTIIGDLQIGGAEPLSLK